MAVTFRSVGTLRKADIAVTGPNIAVALPAGHAAGDLLLMFVLTDSSNSTTTDPPGWRQEFYIATTHASTTSPYYASPRLKVYSRIDNGSLGSAVGLTFVSAAWPYGNPYVLAFVAAYSGCDPAGPIESWAWDTTTSTTAAQAHPAVTAKNAGDVLLTFRAASTDSPAAAFTCTPADTERVDDSDGFDEMSAALYESATIATAGAQTQRTTTASRPAAYGSLMASIVLKPPSAPASVTASPDVAQVSATAYAPTVATQNGPWDLCGADGLPRYSVAIDWNGDGTFTDPSALGDTYASDTFSRTVTGGWGTADTGQAWTVGYTASDHSVSGGSGIHSVGSVLTSRWGVLPSPSADVDVRVDVSTSSVAAGGHMYAYLQARSLGNADFYFARVQFTTAQQVVLTLRKLVGNTETQLASYTTPLTHAAGAWYTVRLRVVGTALWAKAWAVGTAEPDWQATATDTDLTAAGSVGVRSLLGSGSTNALPVTFAYDNLQVSEPLDAEDVTPDLISDLTFTYGRDQERQLSPGAVGSAAFSVNNASRRYSPENTASPLSGDLDPARPMRARVTWNGRTYPLFTGRVDDYTVKTDFGDRSADFTFLDGMSDLTGVTISTGLCVAQRTGELINRVLDEAGWTGGRDIDTGATVVKYWWVDSTDAMSAINDLVKSEGPPAVAYAAPDGTFVFRDRHHRLLRQPSLVPNAIFHVGALGECDAAPAPDGSLDLARPFTYAHGWQNIINSVSFDVADRAPTGDLQQVWSDTGTHALDIGQSVNLTVSSTDPFVGAVTPVPGEDVTYTGSGVLQVLLSRDAGSTARLTLTAVGGPVVVTGCQVRARLLSVVSTTRVSVQDSESIARHGEQTYPDSAPWAGAEDAEAIADTILLHYARRRPTVQIRVVSSDPAHYAQVLTRTVGDRVSVVNDEMGLDGDFFVERVQHVVQRTGTSGRPPVHAAVLGCEKAVEVASNPFTFDKRGSGFDAGVFDPLQSDDASQVFKFDDPVQGLFDTGQFGT